MNSKTIVIDMHISPLHRYIPQYNKRVMLKVNLICPKVQYSTSWYLIFTMKISPRKCSLCLSWVVSWSVNQSNTFATAPVTDDHWRRTSDLITWWLSITLAQQASW